ncbi:hypothetical protein [Bergeriella denitrificans]|uniref:Integral membrane protein n=1 Tax=Bergeriella denitrificans TaxID=494 RepID=A0A378UIR2_BERDE|nr:hypothetical protein [Bergeriella denitrificans]STZ77227.1 Uncharacterised protein [Bergeriella denitrificans]
MQPRQILIIAIRLFVIVWLIQSLNSGFVTARLAADMSAGEYWATYYPLYLGFAACWFFLWFFPATVAKWLLPDYAAQSEEPLPSHPAPWLVTGIALIGLFTLQRAVIDAVYWGTLLHYIKEEGGMVNASIWSLVSFEQKSSIFMTVAEILIGLLLLFRAATVSRWVRRCIG